MCDIVVPSGVLAAPLSPLRALTMRDVSGDQIEIRERERDLNIYSKNIFYSLQY